ncbi:MAG: hypothetical protein N2690_10525 [Rhodocyclaceae bacterium]|nr:hypothetical protein [Rhodocyclaceae bacterium]
MQCAGCCARLVLSAWPAPKLVEAMLASIARFKDAPSREEVLARASMLLFRA